MSVVPLFSPLSDGQTLLFLFPESQSFLSGYFHRSCAFPALSKYRSSAGIFKLPVGKFES